MKKLQNLPGTQEKDFSEVLKLIQTGRFQAYRSINMVMIKTYWSVGAYLSRKVAESGWGKGVVKELSAWLTQKAPDIKGYSAQNLWRMKQLYELYNANPKLSALLRELKLALMIENHCRKNCKPAAPLPDMRNPAGRLLLLPTKKLDFFIGMLNISINNTSHASRKICAPWGVTFFWGIIHEVSKIP